MTDLVPMVEGREAAVEANIVLTSGVHVHARLHPTDLVNGGVMLALRQVQKVHRGPDEVSLHEALGLDPEHLRDTDRVWVPGHLVAAVVLPEPPGRRRPVGFAR